MTVYAFSSFTFSQLGHARVLARTLKALHPDWKLWAVITDRPPEGFVFDPAAGQFDGLLTAEELIGEDAGPWLFSHDIVEARAAVKGPAMARLMDFPDCEKLFFFDPDIALFNTMDEVVRLLDQHAIVLTPHQVDPEPRAARIAIRNTEVASLAHGVFNLGFIAVANDAEGRRFAHWWRDRLLDWCHDNRADGLFVDQKWCNLVPCLFDRVKVLRDPGYNVASRNLSQRRMTFDTEGQALVNGHPLRFFHFTGQGPAADVKMQGHAGASIEIHELWRWYGRQIAEAAAPEIPAGWWHYGHFDNGVPIPREARHLYRRRASLRMAFPRPFATAGESYFLWLQSQAGDGAQPAAPAGG